MRKLFNRALALVLVLGLTACGGKKVDGYQIEDVQAMADAGAFSEELEEMDSDIAFVLYKLADYELSREDLTGCVVLRSAGATCEEGAVLVLASEEGAKSAGEALKAYVQSQIKANEDYRPAEIPKLENAYIDVKGSTVLLIVANDLDAAKKAVD